MTDTPLPEPAAWMIPGDNCRENGFVDVMAWSEGEFTAPLFTRDQLLSALSAERQAREAAEKDVKELQGAFRGQITGEMVARAHAEYHKVLGDPERSNPMLAALEAACICESCIHVAEHWKSKFEAAEKESQTNHLWAEKEHGELMALSKELHEAKAVIAPFAAVSSAILAEAPADATEYTLFTDCDARDYVVTMDTLRAAAAWIAKGETDGN